jgi:hypothetical protein
VTVLFRQYIGIHNYGVFTPALLALALTRNELGITLITIIIVVTFATLGRRPFPEKMIRTPRLSIIFTLVILSMVYAVSLVDFYFPRPEGYAVLLPVIIMASLTDNFYRTFENLGRRIAFIRLLWTFVITIFCIPVLLWDTAGHFLVFYPEWLILVLAIILLVTSYKGGKLNRHLPNFLIEPPVKGKKNSNDEG